MKDEKKQRIVAAIIDYMQRKGLSQNKVAAEIGISPGQMSNVLTAKWESVSEQLWNRLAARFETNDWGIYQTANFLAIQRICQDMQRDSEVMCIAEYSGAGKTVGLESYARQTPGAYYVQCNQLLTKKDFVRLIQQVLGIYSEGRLIEMLEDIVTALNKVEKPVLLIDEADKLTDQNLMICKVIYDRLPYRCGFVVAGTEVLRERIEKNARRNKLGFRELKRRFFSNYQPLHKFDLKKQRIKDEVISMCEDQGISDEGMQAEVLKQSNNYGEVRNLIRRFQRIQKRTAEKEPVNIEQGELELA